MYDLHKLIDAIVLIEAAKRNLGDSMKEIYQKQALTEAVKLLEYEINVEREDFNHMCRAESMGSRDE